ncbi:MAG: substrate-binding domain-containing protein, partial [Pseudomonadota bacterium]
MKIILTTLAAWALLISPLHALDIPASDEVPRGPTKIVGSPTMASFSYVVTDRLQLRGDTSLVTDTTGTSTGFVEFCDSRDPKVAPIVLAPRPMTARELRDCDLAERGAVEEHNLGLTSIVIAEGEHRKRLSLTKTQLFYALAQRVPDKNANCRLVENTAKFWSDVDPTLPRRKIQVFGPPTTSGTRNAFVEMAMQTGALEDPCMKSIQEKKPLLFDIASQAMRNDGTWVDAGENSHAIVAAIMTMPHAIGVLEYPAFFPHDDRV